MHIELSKTSRFLADFMRYQVKNPGSRDKILTTMFSNILLISNIFTSDNSILKIALYCRFYGFFENLCIKGSMLSHSFCHYQETTLMFCH